MRYARTVFTMLDLSGLPHCPSVIPMTQSLRSLGVLSSTAALLVGAACTTTPPPKPEASAATAPTIIAGFATPESVLHDTATDTYLVSNINGSPLDKDGNGFISRLKPDGTIEALKWIDGEKEGVTLNAPKGMAIIAGKLYVADIDTVRVFDATTGAPITAIPVEGATFLNDIAEGKEGAVSVSDSGLKMGAEGFEPTGTDAVYSLTPFGEVLPVQKDPALPRPNGLLVDGDATWVAYFGANKVDALGADGAVAMSVAIPGGSLDGLALVSPGIFLVSSWETNSVYLVDSTATPPAVTVVGAELTSPADIGFDAQRRTVLVPLFTQNSVALVKLP